MAMMQELARQNQALMDVVRAQRSPSSSPPPPRGAPEIKLHGVEPYKGEAGDVCDAWVSQLQLFHDKYMRAGASDDEFVLAAATTLTGGAVVWWQSMEAASRPSTWPLMVAAVRKQFQPVTSESTARTQLLEIKQSPKQTVAEFAAEFRRLLSRAGADFQSGAFKVVLVERFTHGLRDTSIRRDLLKQVPATLAEAIETATRLDGCEGGSSSSSAGVANMEIDQSSMMQQLAALTTEVKALRSAAASQRDFSSSSSSVQSRAPYVNRRERGANNGRQGQPAWAWIPGMTEALAMKRRSEERCFYCGLKGHTARDCTEKAAGRQPNLSAN
jgi:hypothetical protein